jgi:putative redox protein
MGTDRFATRIELPGGPILADEPVEVGGGGRGATPYQLLAAALAACTSMTLRLYAARKRWALGDFAVSVEHSLVEGRDRFTRRLDLPDKLGAEARAALIDIAAKCPIHHTLAGGGAEIVTIAEPEPPVREPPEAHLAQMEQACTD